MESSSRSGASGAAGSCPSTAIVGPPYCSDSKARRWHNYFYNSNYYYVYHYYYYYFYHYCCYRVYLQRQHGEAARRHVDRERDERGWLVAAAW